MAKIEIFLPAMGEGIIEATVTKILKNVGDSVSADEAVFEVATDKVDSEVSAPESGIILQIFVRENDVPQVGSVLAILSTDNSEPDEEPDEEPEEDKSKAKPANKPQVEILEPAFADEPTALAGIAHKTSDGRFVSPLVRAIAGKEGLTSTDLERIAGTGVGKRITKDDILKHIEFKAKPQQVAVLQPKAETAQTTVKVPETKQSAAPANYGKNFEIIEMDRMRKIISDHMVFSKQTSAHVTSFIEIDVTNMVKWREKTKGIFEKKHNEKLTFTPIFIEAAVAALTKYPMVNVSVDGNKIILKKDFNIGMATALPSGNLIVPVIKNAERLNLLGISQMVNELAARARINKLLPDEISGGTFTITNLGQFGNLTGTPIINQPQVAILAVGAIKKKPWVMESAEGDSIAIRQIMVASMSYDHRVVDGALGGMFIKAFSDNLEGFDVNRAV